MRNFPVTLLHAFGPGPETTLPDSAWLVSPKVFVQVKTFSSSLINYKPRLMHVMRRAFVSCDFRGEIFRRNFGLSHSHMAHLRSRETHAITNCVDSFVANH